MQTGCHFTKLNISCQAEVYSEIHIFTNKKRAVASALFI